MTQTAERIFNDIRVLSRAERDKLDRLLETESANGNSNGVREHRNERWERSQMWINANKHKYDGQFVLLDGDELVGHGSDAKELYKLARDRGIAIPYVEKIRAIEEPYFGGW
ncbi:MAG TPA: DUF5678 domain-containing protein [Pyrinomonadaceae bacterium]|nr:DUF5678 domain-containing protein [Pyrinomonadaceae bacterium]